MTKQVTVVVYSSVKTIYASNSEREPFDNESTVRRIGLLTVEDNEIVLEYDSIFWELFNEAIKSKSGDLAKKLVINSDGYALFGGSMYSPKDAALFFANGLSYFDSALSSERALVTTVSASHDLNENGGVVDIVYKAEIVGKSACEVHLRLGVIAGKIISS